MKHNGWKMFLGAMLLCAAWLVTGNVHADQGYELEDFGLRSAQDLLEVCTLEPSHPHHEIALAFCYGFFEGAIHYAKALGDSRLYANLVCPPAGTTRSEATAVIVTYLQANPQYGTEAPLDAAFRALIDKWPCQEQKASCTTCSE